ncbi:MAG: type I 3-dehydroquinate dehydratase [Nitrososphaeria archaeon]
MRKPKLCAVISNNNAEWIRTANSADLIEVRIDMIGEYWRSLLKTLRRPWIGCNRSKNEGGTWNGTESERIRELLDAISLGATYIDIELRSDQVKEVIKYTKKSNKKVIISYHDTRETPTLAELKQIIKEEACLGADLCKLVTTANRFEDNLTILQLLQENSDLTRITAFCMGEKGIVSRILSPLFGGELVYVSTGVGSESATGQISLESFKKIYKMIDQKTRIQLVSDRV